MSSAQENFGEIATPRSVRIATYGWYGLAIYIVLFDLAALGAMKKKGAQHLSDTQIELLEGQIFVIIETLSMAFNSAVSTPRGKVYLGVLWSMITFHLFKSAFPAKLQKLDPMTGSVTAADKLTLFLYRYISQRKQL